MPRSAGAAAGDGDVPGVVVTRDEGPDGRLTRLLEERGLRVHHWPTIRVGPPEDVAPLDAALADLGAFDWVVFTSPRAVAAVMERVTEGAALAGCPRIAAVGEATASAVEEAGWSVDLAPDTQTGEALVAALLAAGMEAGTRVLFPASAIARDTVPDGLGEAGVVVVQVEAYRTEPAPLDRAACARALESGAVSLVAFTSPSTVTNLELALGQDLFEIAVRRTRAVAIGPTTGEAAAGRGFDVEIAEPHSLEGLAERVARVAGRIS